MASRPVIIASLLGASIGVPYFASKAGHREDAAPAITPLPSVTASAPETPASGTPAIPTPAAMAAALTPPGPPGSTTIIPRSPSAEQALRFDVTKEWVYRSFDRKSAGPTDLGLFAVRVPLVSGTQSSSLAGSLTYYFNIQNQVEHISFRGRTADPSQLVRYVMQRYQFEPISAHPGEQVYRVADRGGVRSELRTRLEPIAAGASPQAAHSVELELAHPDSARYLPPRGPFLNVPLTPDVQAQAEAAAAQAAKAAEESGGSFLDKFRYATPVEKNQAILDRLPN